MSKRTMQTGVRPQHICLRAHKKWRKIMNNQGLTSVLRPSPLSPPFSPLCFCLLLLAECQRKCYQHRLPQVGGGKGLPGTTRELPTALPTHWRCKNCLCLFIWHVYCSAENTLFLFAPLNGAPASATLGIYFQFQLFFIHCVLCCLSIRDGCHLSRSSGHWY